MDSLQGHYYSLKSLQRLKSLCRMLRNNADQILAAEMSVTIASSTLYELNEAIDNLQDGLSPSSLSLDMNTGDRLGSRTSDLEEWNFHLQLVLDVISKAPVLVLYKPEACGSAATESSPSNSSSSPSQPLRLGYFTSLSHLEISSVPICTIQDLLKMRERLRTLVVVNCFASNFRLQDVLEMCDQEVSVPMQWAVLQHLCVRNNNLMELDGSLRLCPRLEMLDLSKNNLVTTDVYIGYLMEITHLDLSHNALMALPTVSATAKKKLRILRLAGNKISSLKGVEEMTSLQELDISENLIASHHCLHPIKGLHRLDRLNMRGCPATMKRDHRILALQFISTVSLSRKFFLDSRPVTHKEIQNSRAIVSLADQPRPRQHVARRTIPHPERAVGGADHLSHLVRGEEEPPSTTEDSVVGVTSSRKRKSRKKAKARTMDIADMDLSGGDMSTEGTPSTTPRAPSRMEALAQLRKQEVQETRAEIEQLRRYYGENWLQAVEDQGILPRPNSVVNTGTLSSAVVDAAHDSAASKSQTLRKSCTDVALVANKECNLTAQVDVHEDELGSKVNGNSQMSGFRAAERAKCSETAWGPGERIFSKEDMFLSSSSGAEDGGASDQPARTSARPSAQSDSIYVHKESKEMNSADLAGANRKVELEEKEDSQTASEKSPESTLLYDTQDSVEEPEEQSDPFIVTLPDLPDDPFLITVSPRYLVEKDINGVMKEKLDLQSLEAVRTEGEESVDKSETDGDIASRIDPQEVKVILDFSSVRKDRRCRVYVMEDLVTAQHLCELVQPFVDAKVEAARKKLEVMYQCLKCGSQFLKGEATTVVYRESVPHTGSIKDFASMADIGSQKELLQCPRCGSDHVVLLESELPTHPSPALSSSLPSEGLPPTALLHRQSVDMQVIRSQTPQAHSTPKRLSLDGIGRTDVAGQKRSGSSTSHSLFLTCSSDGGQTGDGPDVSQASGITKKQEEENPPAARQRSNAFYSPHNTEETRCLSDAITSPAELKERATSDSVTSQKRDMEGARLSSSVTSVEAVDRQPFRAFNNLPQSPSGNSSEYVAARTVSSSADSDIAVLNKRDSVASVVVLPSSDVSRTDCGQDDSTNWAGHRPPTSDLVLNTRRNSDSSIEVETHSEPTTLDRGALTPVQQEPDSMEATPMGSPLSQSICSSMVSSVYNNSLLPNNSTSNVDASASEFHTAEGDSLVVDSDGEIETSIYDQAAPVPVRRSSHKPSVSSEVEVLSVEEDAGPTQNDHNISLCENATTTTIISGDTTVDGETEDGTDGATLTGSTSTRVKGLLGSEEGYDFKRLDHRLALHLMMNVFDNNEEFKFKVKTCVCQYVVLEEYEALVAVTNLKLYILRINTEDTSVELTEGLTLMEAQPHAELRRVDVGMGRQTLRLEYMSDCSSYTLVMRDRDKVDAFAELLSDQIQAYSVETGVPMTTVFSEGTDQETLDTLSADVLDKGGKSQQPLRLYILGYIARGHNLQYPIAFVVSTSELCLVKTNHQWPSPQHQTPVTVETVGKQFTVLERQRISNIATVEVNETNPCWLRVTFFNESSGDETNWLVSMETRQCVKDFIEAVREPWEQEFGVQMDVEPVPFDLSF